MNVMSRRALLLGVGCLFAIGCAGELSSEGPRPPLAEPTLTEPASGETFQALFKTTQGEFVIKVHRDWSPNGAERFHELVKSGFFDDQRFFRVVPGFMVQWGIPGDPDVAAKWADKTIRDDRVKQSNKRGFVTFAKSGAPNSRSTQIFINFGNNSRLDGDGFSPFGEVVRGMDVVDSLYSGYGENPRNMNVQGNLREFGNQWLDIQFPELDHIESARIITENGEPAESPGA
ncbi:peptidylprolyl isomerase [Stratiformator vulcanicus]|uniref:Peptidyl-prolyl cis-trans isomerase n=1 Tax=Stratiformator vulcanicus TaxID=2527980 RepID=A0A517R5R8_9PLAN|nr:peptidylprolyl isomerase [Stratiformator vulcanicus]QDT39221.1 Peptidyl-prolyl cis-trans isomerase B [Stratiformator vulcanicus]